MTISVHMVNFCYKNNVKRIITYDYYKCEWRAC